MALSYNGNNPYEQKTGKIKNKYILSKPQKNFQKCSLKQTKRKTKNRQGRQFNPQRDNGSIDKCLLSSKNEGQNKMIC